MTNLEALVSMSQTLLRVRGQWVVAGIDAKLSVDIRQAVGDIWPLMLVNDDTIIAQAVDELERRAIALDTTCAERRENERLARQREADHVDGYDRDDLGESPDF